MSFLVIIVLPIMMAVMIGKMIINYQIKSIEETYNIEFTTRQAITNPIQILNRVTRDSFNRIKLYAMKNPEVLENMDFLSRLNSELLDKYSFLVVYHDNNVVFEGNPSKFEDVKKMLPTNSTYSTDVDGGIYIGGKTPILVKQQQFICTDGALGTVLILTDINNVVPQIRSFAIQAVISFIFIIVLTALILIIWLYRGIIRPLNLLKRATKEMKEGNLDYSISSNSNDEIGQLCEDFEEMRIHLKELIEVKMQYETSSRELLSNISHDLKTPLTTIKGYAEGIIDGVAVTPEKLDRYVKTIYMKANDMQALVDELSMFSKLDSNDIPYNFRIIEASDFFSDCIDELSFELEMKHITLEYKNEAKIPCRVIADTEQLKRVIHNIIGNSVKYMDKEAGEIKVMLSEGPDLVQIAFQDNGSGIEEKDLPNIFERFFRADLSRNSKTGGTGLGLAIARKIIEEHGGSIWATSQVGVGTTIYFTIMKWSDQSVDKDKLPRKIKKAMILNVKE